MGKPKQTVTIPRNAINGRYVTLEYAIKHPRTTEVEHRPRPKK